MGCLIRHFHRKVCSSSRYLLSKKNRFKMWKSTVGAKNGPPANKVVIPTLNNDDDDDWETDPDYVNEMSEEQQRWGGARDTGVLDMDKFREEVRQESDAAIKKKASLYPSSRGYG